jgi:hypothetical protein
MLLHSPTCSTHSVVLKLTRRLTDTLPQIDMTRTRALFVKASDWKRHSTLCVPPPPPQWDATPLDTTEVKPSLRDHGGRGGVRNAGDAAAEAGAAAVDADHRTVSCASE